MKIAAQTGIARLSAKKVPEYRLRDRDIVITTLFFHPDYTVGTGVSPIQPARVSRVADFTASEESHLALKNYFYYPYILAKATAIRKPFFIRRPMSTSCATRFLRTQALN